LKAPSLSSLLSSYILFCKEMSHSQETPSPDPCIFFLLDSYCCAWETILCLICQNGILKREKAYLGKVLERDRELPELSPLLPFIYSHMLPPPQSIFHVRVYFLNAKFPGGRGRSEDPFRGLSILILHPFQIGFCQALIMNRQLQGR